MEPTKVGSPPLIHLDTPRPNMQVLSCHGVCRLGTFLEKLDCFVPAHPCGILHERQAGREERCAQGSLDSILDRSPKSFGISRVWRVQSVGCPLWWLRRQNQFPANTRL